MTTEQMNNLLEHADSAMRRMIEDATLNLAKAKSRLAKAEAELDAAREAEEQAYYEYVSAAGGNRNVAQVKENAHLKAEVRFEDAVKKVHYCSGVCDACDQTMHDISCHYTVYLKILAEFKAGAEF